jgi:hypothetical protein
VIPGFFYPLLHIYLWYLISRHDDFCRCLAEFKSGAERKDVAESTMNAYKAT